MKKIIKISVIFLFLATLVNSCNKDDEQLVNQFEQEEFIPENGGNGGNSGYCQCVAYIKHQLGITTSTANAKDWGITYTPSGYSLVSGVPQQKDIVVITPEFGGVNATYGHIGFVNSVSNVNGDNFYINIIAANYNSLNLFTSCDCNNVNTLQNVSINSANRNKIRFYRNTSNSLNCSDFTNPINPTRVINLNGNLSYGNVIIGTTQTRTLTLSNLGNSSLTINSINLPTGYSSNYSSGTINAGGSATANISFSPLNMVTNYNGVISINSNATSGGNTINVNGSGINNTTTPTFNPSLNTFTGCSFANQIGSGDCSGNTYLGSTINMKASTYNQSTNTINFTISKCSGTFSNTGTVYIKQGNYCGNIVAQSNYSIGASNINLSVTPPTNSGTYTYTAVIVSATTDKFYTLSITVQY